MGPKIARRSTSLIKRTPLREREHDRELREAMELLSSFCSRHEDIYLEILTRLDVKSLSRFKLVSKQWYMFLSDPSFSMLYSKKRPSITGFFYQTSQDYQEKLRYVPIDAKEAPIVDPPSCLGFLDDPVILYDSCNGLLHWSCEPDDQQDFISNSCRWSCEPDQHFISNPLTNKFIALSWPTTHPNESFASGIAFDPSVSDHFRIVVLVVQSQVTVKSTIFSSETMQWDEGKETLALDTRNVPFYRNRGVFLNGFLFWELNSNALLACKVEDRSFHLMHLPLTNELAGKLVFLEPGCLGESGEILHYCRLMGTVLCVWVATHKISSMNATTNWVYQHLVNLSEVVCGKPSIKPYGFQALAFLPDCEGVLMGVERKIISYCFSGCTVHEVCKVRRNGVGSDDSVQPSFFFPFVHSLALSSFPSRRSA